MLTIGIPTLDRDKILLDTLKMVLDQDYKDFEVIVADQTTDHPPEFLNQVSQLVQADKRLRYFLVKPANLPAARNFVLHRAKGDLVLFIDDDVKLDKQFISAHIKAQQEHPEATAVAGRIEQKGLPLSDFPLFFDKYGLPQGTFNCPNSGPATMWPGGNHSVKTEIMKKVGGYSTLYKKDAVREESDAAYRLMQAGYSIYYSAEARLTHLSVNRGGSRIYKPQFDNFRFYINDLIFCFRTVSFIHLPMALFRRLRIYSGGTSLISVRRFKRALIFCGGIFVALWKLVFNVRSRSCKMVREIA